MSLGYADKLKRKKNVGGQLGATEYFDEVSDVVDKMKRVAQMMSAKGAKTVAFTGAGISTSIGIPDFRGPSGIWTLRSKKQALPPMTTRFEYAVPSYTHMALVALWRAGLLSNACSQNVDSLHVRSGLPRQRVAELHGNCFAERCHSCHREYQRDFEIETVGFKPTGRMCTHPGCGGALYDNTLDWDSPLPEDELDEAIECADQAAVNLVLGTSLQIAPANELPLITRAGGGKVVIVNLQKTPRDRQAHVIARARVDFCMALIMRELAIAVPQYERYDSVVVASRVVDSPAPGGGGFGIAVRVHSQHGEDLALPMVESVAVRVLSSSGEALDVDGTAAAAAATATPAPVLDVDSTVAAAATATATTAPAPAPRTTSPAGDKDSGSDANASIVPGTVAGLPVVLDPAGSGMAAPAGTISGSMPSGSSDAPVLGGVPGSLGVPGASPGVLPRSLVATGAAPFTFDLSGAALCGSHASHVVCELELRLCAWADADKRTVVVRHEVARDGSARAGQSTCGFAWRAKGRVPLPPGIPGARVDVDDAAESRDDVVPKAEDPFVEPAGPAAREAHAVRLEEPETASGEGHCSREGLPGAAGERSGSSGSGSGSGGPNPSAVPADGQTASHAHAWVRSVARFMTQRVQHDGSAIIDGYLANPPEVKQPEPRGRKKQKP